MSLLVGTSGWQYRDWREVVYGGAPPRTWLARYSAELPTVEVNNAFYRLPERSVFARWHELLNPLVPEEELTVLHTRYPAIRFAFVELARRAAGDPREDDRLFTSHLTDLVTALLASQASTQTTRLLALRRQDTPPA